MNAKVLSLLGLVAVVAADERPSYGYSAPDHYSSEEYGPAKYYFDWSVSDSYENNFGHQESRDGNHTKGSYYVHLPDGCLQTVTYYVEGDSGFIADVQYTGEAHYDSGSDEHYSPPRNSYSAP